MGTMKINIKIVQEVEYEFDYDAEVKMINKIFGTKPREKYIPYLIAVLDAFWIDRDIEKMRQLYHDLPYNEEDEYPLQESVGWMYRLQRHFEENSDIQYIFPDKKVDKTE